MKAQRTPLQAPESAATSSTASEALSIEIAAAEAPRPFVRVQPSRGWTSLGLADLWTYRELVYFLTWRDVKVRYKQTVLGVAWAVLQPVLTTLIFSLFFGRLAGIPSDGVPYPIFALAGLVPWTFFANGLTQASNSLVGNANLITKVYFPRLIVPIAAVLSGVIDVLLACLVLVAMMAYYQIAPSAQVIWLPAILLLVLIVALGTGLWFSAMNVQFRDVRYTVPFLTQLWMLATPIAYPSSMLHQPWRTVFAINPMVGAVEGVRWAVFAGTAPPIAQIVVSFSTAAVVLVSGALYFRRMERTFADVV
jgi:lipopolysaccharide transport system permease protein